MYSFKYSNIKAIAYNNLPFFSLSNLRFFFPFWTQKKKKRRPTRFLLNPNTRTPHDPSLRNSIIKSGPKLNLIRFNVMRNNIHASIKFNKILIPLLFFLFSFFFFLPPLLFFHSTSFPFIFLPNQTSLTRHSWTRKWKCRTRARKSSSRPLDTKNSEKERERKREATNCLECTMKKIYICGHGKEGKIGWSSFVKYRFALKHNLTPLAHDEWLL